MRPIDKVHTERMMNLEAAESRVVEAMTGRVVRDAVPQDKTWYLAHPLTADKRFTFQENIAHIEQIQRILWVDSRILTIAPYLEQIKFLDNDDPEDRVHGLRSDQHVVAAMGAIVLTGHRLTEGMRKELDALQFFGQVINLIGIPDRELWKFVPKRLV